jgi:poly(A) polymerase
LKACARLKDSLDRLSAERVWSELKKLLAAPDPARALLWMRQSGVLGKVLPETEKWGIDAIHALVCAEKDLKWQPDALLRLEAIVPPDAPRMTSLAARLKLSSKEAGRLSGWASESALSPEMNDLALRKRLYFGDVQGIADRLALGLASARWKAISDNGALEDAAGFSRLLNIARSWEKPPFPIKGSDLIALGMAAGPQMGEAIRALESVWADSGFVLDRSALLEKAKALPSIRER